MNKLDKKIKIILLLSIMWGLIVLGIPRIPYKTPDKYGVLTFDVYEWYPLVNNIYLKDTVEWDKYKTIHMIVSLIISLLLIVLMFRYWYDCKYNKE
ncbi:MAG: hypothetical protein E7214_02310 [Clostridium sp.]|nr:hypothetical protein [Clostridium sp.]